MKTLIIMMVVAMLNGGASERITYYDHSEEVEFELVRSYRGSKGEHITELKAVNYEEEAD